MTKLFNQIELIERIDQLIRLKATGSPKALAEKLNVSESTIYRIVDTIKELGAPVDYNLVYQSYVYTEEVNFLCGFFSCELSRSDYKKVNGGFGNLQFLVEKDFSLSKFESGICYPCK
ncbi:helix-turn-helix domain-containing protein [Maribellus luteus]|uniref:Helix-turn-helix domain-containing protein n=1 Tax=Maribellus luteus TaxID=2305463 RepID=A0A399SQ88_9BACT|nr:helix-turn-helix domain-containing protein [Maribellus luteus]RIJ46176.1 helix-turn-helix domain-containing protein [Maribellus luteus]